MKRFFKRDPELETILARKEFLLKSAVFRNQKHISSKMVVRMIEKLFEEV